MGYGYLLPNILFRMTAAFCAADAMSVFDILPNAPLLSLGWLAFAEAPPIMPPKPPATTCFKMTLIRSELLLPAICFKIPPMSSPLPLADAVLFELPPATCLRMLPKSIPPWLFALFPPPRMEPNTLVKSIFSIFFLVCVFVKPFTRYK